MAAAASECDQVSNYGCMAYATHNYNVCLFDCHGTGDF